MAVIDLEIFSPRWGNRDVYQFELERDALTISLAPRVSRLVWVDNSDPRWKGESLVDILENNSIYPPEVFYCCIEHAWKSWRNGVMA